MPELSQLLKAVKGLYLPTVLAKYVEAIGTCKTASGADIAPWFSTREAMLDRHLGRIDPDMLLREAHRHIPENYWSIDRDWIAHWNQATTRPSRIGMQFRYVTWAGTASSVEMLVTPVDAQDHQVSSTSAADGC